MLYGVVNFQIIIVKFYYIKQMFKIAWNKIILNNSEEGDEAESSNKSKAEELK